MYVSLAWEMVWEIVIINLKLWYGIEFHISKCKALLNLIISMPKAMSCYSNYIIIEHNISNTCIKTKK